MKIAVVIFIGFTLLGCSRKNEMSLPQDVTITKPAPIMPGDSVMYLALGDSYTFGVGVTQNESYPFQIAAQLKSEDFRAASPVVIATSGWTAADLLKGIDNTALTKKFDIVTLLIGVNDQNKGTDKDIYTTELDKLIMAAAGYAKGNSSRVFVISIPDWSVTPHAAGMDRAAIKTQIAIFNSINLDESRRMGANYIDLTDISELAADDPSLTGTDGFHPTAKMYALWVDRIYGKITSTFK